MPPYYYTAGSRDRISWDAIPEEGPSNKLIQSANIPFGMLQQMLIDLAKERFGVTPGSIRISPIPERCVNPMPALERGDNLRPRAASYRDQATSAGRTAPQREKPKVKRPAFQSRYEDQQRRGTPRPRAVTAARSNSATGRGAVYRTEEGSMPRVPSTNLPSHLARNSPTAQPPSMSARTSKLVAMGVRFLEDRAKSVSGPSKPADLSQGMAESSKAVKPGETFIHNGQVFTKREITIRRFATAPAPTAPQEPQAPFGVTVENLVRGVTVPDVLVRHTIPFR